MAFNFNVSPMIARRGFSIVGLALIFILGVGSIRQTGQKEERPKMNIELQFTEGFTGQKISIRIEGEIVADFTAQTKFQTGLAHIEVLDLQDGEEVTVTIGEPEIELRLDVDASQPFVTFALQDGILNVSKTDKRPGYL